MRAISAFTASLVMLVVAVLLCLGDLQIQPFLLLRSALLVGAFISSVYGVFNISFR